MDETELDILFSLLKLLETEIEGMDVELSEDNSVALELLLPLLAVNTETSEDVLADDSPEAEIPLLCVAVEDGFMRDESVITLLITSEVEIGAIAEKEVVMDNPATLLSPAVEDVFRKNQPELMLALFIATGLGVLEYKLVGVDPGDTASWLLAGTETDCIGGEPNPTFPPNEVTKPKSPDPAGT